MAVKTITIDLEAYERLARHKSPGQSFSKVIKEHFGHARTGRRLAAALAALELDPATPAAIERRLAARRKPRGPAA